MSNTLTKAQVVDAVALANGFTRLKSIEAVETLLELIKSMLESGEDAMISGFGKFCVKQKSPLCESPFLKTSLNLRQARVVRTIGQR